jgi:cell division protein FtsQ
LNNNAAKDIPPAAPFSAPRKGRFAAHGEPEHRIDGHSIDIGSDDSDIIDVEKEGAFKFEKPLKKLIVVLALLLCAELVWLFVVSPCMPLTTVTVTGMDTPERAHVLYAAGITARSSYISINEKQIEKNLLTLPQVEKAVVAKHFPDTLTITLIPRKLLAVSLLEIHNKIEPVLFDANGVVFQIGKHGVNVSAGAPVISGLFNESVRMGDVIPAVFLPFLSSLQELGENADGLLSSISEIYVNKKAYNTFDLLIYPAYNQTKIRMNGLNEDNLRYMFLLLDVFAEKNMDVEEIDFRTGTASYKIRGQEGV